MATSSVGKPPGHVAVFGFYNITWQKSRFSGKGLANHTKASREDLRAGIQQHNVDAVLLSECGVIEEGSGHSFHHLLKQICEPEFSVTCQSHYACIIRTSRIDVTKEPSLTEALSPLADHVYRRCQHLQVTLKSQIAYEPIDVYNLH